MQEFSSIYKAYAAERDAAFKDSWERTRMLAALMLQPYIGKGKTLKPKDLLSFPWEEEKKSQEPKEKIDIEERRRRMERIARRLGTKLITDK